MNKTEVISECGDGLDNDGDLLTDYPDDPDCFAAGEIVRLVYVEYSAEILEVDGEGASFLIPFDQMNTENPTDGCRASSGPEGVVLITLNEPSNVEVTFEDLMLNFLLFVLLVMMF